MKLEKTRARERLVAVASSETSLAHLRSLNTACKSQEPQAFDLFLGAHASLLRPDERRPGKERTSRWSPATKVAKSALGSACNARRSCSGTPGSCSPPTGLFGALVNPPP